MYDLRTNVPKVTKGHPLTPDYFREFTACYGTRHTPRGGERQEGERFKKFTRQEVADRDDNLDIFWLKDENLEDSDDLPEPEDLVSEALTQLETAMDALNDLAMQLGMNGNNGGVKEP